MKITLIAVGKLKKSPEKEIFDDYIKRLKVDFILKEVEDKKNLSGEKLKEAESKLIKEHIPDSAVIVALDERGKVISSRDFADKIEKWQGEGANNLVFIIGGADGLHESIRERADLTLSFGKLTWPHMLARVMFSEQIYRAFSIIDSHPYHRD